MDERHIERALRSGPPDEPVYRPVLSRQLAAELGMESGATDESVSAGGVRRIRVRTCPGPTLSVWQAAGSIVMGLVIVVAVTITLRFALPEVPPAAEDDLLSQLRAGGVVRIAVTNQPPQAPVGGAYIGFDVHVAEALSAAMALRPTISVRPPEEVLATADGWDVALPSRALDLPSVNYRTSRPYYAWPVWLVVPADSTVDAIDQLAGATICVVSGSVGADWLQGRAPQTVETMVARPSGTQVLEREDDLGCTAALVSRDADAALTAALLDDDFAAQGLRMVGPREVLREPRSVIVAGSPEATSRLIEAIDAALSDLRSSGRLAELSQRSFGGRDLTEETR